MYLIGGLTIPFLGTTLGAAMVFLMRGTIDPRVEKLLLGFASGVMIAASVWSLLIPSINMAAQAGKVAWVPAVAGFLLGIEAFTAAVLGGIGNLRGALLGGLLLGVLQNYAAGLFGTQWLHAASFVLLVVILLFRPTGILGESLQKARA